MTDPNSTDKPGGKPMSETPRALPKFAISEDPWQVHELLPDKSYYKFLCRGDDKATAERIVAALNGPTPEQVKVLVEGCKLLVTVHRAGYALPPFATDGLEILQARLVLKELGYE